VEPDLQRRLDELIGAHLDGALDATQAEELAVILAGDRDARRDFARSVAFETVLPRVAPRPRLRLVYRASALAAAAVLLVGVGWWLARPMGDGPELESGGIAVILRGGHELTPAMAGVLRDADVVQVQAGPVALRWPTEGTRMVLGSGSVLTLTHGGPTKDVELRSGWVDVAAAHQTNGRHLTVRTAQAAVEVVGTRFVVAHAAGNSSIEVAEGAVAVQAGGARRTVEHGQRAVVSPGGALQVGSRDGIAPAGASGPGARLDVAAWQADQGRDWEGTMGRDGLVALVEQTAERVGNPQRMAGYAHLWPDLSIDVDVTLTHPGTLALFLVCRRPDGSDWTGNYTVQELLPAGRHRRAWSIADVRIEKGTPLAEALGARITRVVACGWNQPVGLVVHEVVVRNGGSEALPH
jgi:hypothetical protein